MKTNYIYIGVVVLIIILGLLLFGGVNTDKIVEMATTTPTNTNGQTVISPPNLAVQPPSAPSKPSQQYQTPNSGSTPSTDSGQAGSQSKPTIPTASYLNGRIFKLVSYNGSPIPVGTTYTIAFDNGRLNAKFCNSMSGNFVLDGGLIKVSNLASTLMYCSTPSNLMDIETLFGSMLGYGALIYQSENQIVLSRSPGGVLVFQGF